MGYGKVALFQERNRRAVQWPDGPRRSSLKNEDVILTGSAGEWRSKIMKMLLSSSDRSVVKRVEKALVASGIPCALRHDERTPCRAGLPVYPELWVQDDNEFRLASMLSASLLVR
jgi:hypothetical protein